MSINNSEAQAARYLTTAFKRTFDDVRILTGVVLRLPDGARLPTAEYDCIVICNAGVYLFEVKAWNHCLVGREKIDGGHQWYLDQFSGERLNVKDPVAQGSEKFQAMRGYLDSRIALRSYVVLPSEDVQISPTLPASVLTAQDISYISRLCNSATKASKKFMKLDTETVELLADYIKEMSGVLSLKEHIDNCQRFQLKKKTTGKVSGLMASSAAPPGAAYVA